MFNFLKKSKEKQRKSVSQLDYEKCNSRENLFKMIIEQETRKSPSEHFASGAVFDISRQNRNAFKQVLSANDLSILELFVNSYMLFLNNPQIVGFTPVMVNKENNDTKPETWNADVFKLQSGDFAALLFMPIQHETLTARIVGIIFGEQGDGYYYCMLNKDGDVFSDVMRNKGMLGIETVGEIKGVGFEMMNSFLNCITNDFYRSV